MTELTIDILNEILDSTVKDISNNTEKQQREPQKNKTKCFLCLKKVGLVGIECRCGYIYCSSCRLPEKHNCSFDYLTYERKLLQKANEKVVSQMEKI